jgi:hypothetical protein
VSGETLQQRMTRLLAAAHAEADANNLSAAIEAASAAHDDWVQAGCPDSDERDQQEEAPR